MQDETRTMEQDVDRLEKAIIKRIDAIFDHEVPENRFVRSSPAGEQQNSVVALTSEFVGRLESFLNSISARRRELKVIMDRLPSAKDQDQIKGQALLREVEGLVDAIQQVGWSAETALKQVLGLTRQMLEGITPR
jgi:hypothetical protein